MSSLRLSTLVQNICVKFTISAKTRKPKMRLGTLEGQSDFYLNSKYMRKIHDY